MTNPLIQLGDWKLSSGRSTDFKLVADQFIADNLDGLVCLIRQLVGSYGEVYAASGCCDRLAAALRRTQQAVPVTLLIDDVLTTGNTLESLREYLSGPCNRAINTRFVGAVVFTRGPLPLWVKAVFQLPSGLWGTTRES